MVNAWDFLLDLSDNDRNKLEEHLLNRTDGKWTLKSYDVPSLVDVMLLLAIGPDAHERNTSHTYLKK